MYEYDQNYLFRNTAMKLGYCTDLLENIAWDDFQWNDPEEEESSHKIRKWCQQYIEAYDFLHGDKPADTE